MLVDTRVVLQSLAINPKVGTQGRTAQGATSSLLVRHDRRCLAGHASLTLRLYGNQRQVIDSPVVLQGAQPEIRLLPVRNN